MGMSGTRVPWQVVLKDENIHKKRVFPTVFTGLPSSLVAPSVGEWDVNRP